MAQQEPSDRPTDVQLTDASQATPAETRGVVVTVDMLMGFLAAALVLFGSFGPWVNAGLVDVSGIRGDGVITLVLAVLGLLVVGIGRWYLVAVAAGVATAGIAIHHIAAIGSVSDEELFAVSVGWGLIACLLGAVGLLAWALTALWNRSDRRAAYAGGALASVVLIVVVTLAVSGAFSGGSQDDAVKAAATDVATPEPTPNAPATAPDTEEASSSAPAAAPVGVGGQIRLAGSGGLEMMATVEGVIDPVYGSEYDTPATGKRYVAVMLRLTNTGDVPYSDSPSNGASLTYGDDRDATASLLTGGQCSGGFSSSSKIAVGAKRKGCIVFEVPKANTIKTFQLTLESGFADQTGTWNIRSANGRAPARRSSPSTSSASSPARAPDARPSAGSASRACDQNIDAGAGTTCDFANSVFKSYAAKVQAGGGSDKAVTAYSSAVGSNIDVYCTYDGYDAVSCDGGDGASVTFPKWAADVY